MSVESKNHDWTFEEAVSQWCPGIHSMRAGGPHLAVPRGLCALRSWQQGKVLKEGFYGMKFDQNQSYISSCESKSRTFWP